MVCEVTAPIWRTQSPRTARTCCLSALARCRQMSSNAAGKRRADEDGSSSKRQATDHFKLQWTEISAQDYERKPAYTVSHKGLTATFNRGLGEPHGSVLPTTGRWSFKLRIDNTSNNSFQLGVGAPGGVCGWMFNPPGGNMIIFGDPPAGYPGTRGQSIQVFEQGTDVWVGSHTAAGHVVKAVSKSLGTVIEFAMDFDSGVLAIGVNGGPLREALSGFPPGAQLCPHWRGGVKGDRVSFVSGILDLPDVVTAEKAALPEGPSERIRDGTAPKFTLVHPGVEVSDEGRVAALGGGSRNNQARTALCGSPLSSGTHSVTIRVENGAKLGMAPPNTSLITVHPNPNEMKTWIGDTNPSVGLGSNGFLHQDGKFTGPFGEWGVALCHSKVRMEYDASTCMLRWFKGDQRLAEASNVPVGWHFGVSANFAGGAEIVG